MLRGFLKGKRISQFKKKNNNKENFLVGEKKFPSSFKKLTQEKLPRIFLKKNFFPGDKFF